MLQEGQILGSGAIIVGLAAIPILLREYLDLRRAKKLLLQLDGLTEDYENAWQEWTQANEKISQHRDLHRIIKAGLGEWRHLHAGNSSVDQKRSVRGHGVHSQVFDALFGAGTARASEIEPTQTQSPDHLSDIWIDRTPLPKRGCSVYIHVFECLEIPAVLEYSLGISENRKRDKLVDTTAFIRLVFASLEQLECLPSNSRCRLMLADWSASIQFTSEPAMIARDATIAVKSWATQALERSMSDIGGNLSPSQFESLVRDRDSALSWLRSYESHIKLVRSELQQLRIL